MFNPTYIEQCVLRRKRVFDEIGVHGIAVLFSASEKKRSGDTSYPFRQDSDFYYLSGFDEPDAVLILDGATRETILFCRDSDPEREMWEGSRYGIEKAREYFKIEYTASINQWQKHVKELLKGHRQLWTLNRYNKEKKLLQMWHDLYQPHTSQSLPESCMNLRTVLDSMRLIKDEVELELLRHAAKISAFGHVKAMCVAAPKMYEYHVEGEILSEFFRHGIRQCAYNTIVAAGKNACTLHYTNNESLLQSGQLVLVDAGAEWQNYAGDISRTFPVDNDFTPAQRDLYQVVLDVNKKVIGAARAGVTYESLNNLSVELLTQGLLDLKLLSGSLNDNIEKQKYKRFYMHSIGHWLGLDVHDVGGRFEHGQSIVLRENMCMTIEPGLYIPDDVDIPTELRGVGVRIEDNIIIHQDESEVCTDYVPKEIDEIEGLNQ